MTPTPLSVSSDSADADGVDVAISHVLEAEHAAQQIVAEAQSEAARMIEQARAAIRALDERTERRIRAVRAAFDKRAAAAVAALDQEIDRLSTERAPQADPESVQAAVDALAARLAAGAP